MVVVVVEAEAMSTAATPEWNDLNLLRIFDNILLNLITVALHNYSVRQV